MGVYIKYMHIIWGDMGYWLIIRIFLKLMK